MKRFVFSLLLFLPVLATAQNPPYDKPPAVEPPYFRVRYEASEKPGELIFPVQYTVWIPEGVKSLRGVVVHQHGCGEGSCKSGQTGAFDLHWQALAKKHDCALMAPSYEQPQDANCQMWCDPRNGSDAAFQKALSDLGQQCGHPELATVPWAIWGHSGGGHWCGGMVMLHPDRVAAAWLRSGVPLFETNPKRDTIKPYELPDAALGVPIMCNLGTKEGVTVTEGRFSGNWANNQSFFKKMRGKGAPIGIAVDPYTSHECGNQRYLAIPWLDLCITERLPDEPSDPLKPMPTDGAWLAEVLATEAVPAAQYSGDENGAVWLPNEKIAKAWMHYVKDTEIPDTSPPPSPSGVEVSGNELTWTAEADLQSGLAEFIVVRDGKEIATVEGGKNPFGRPIFQGLQYSDTPLAPLEEMKYTDETADAGSKHEYHVISVNSVGLRSE